jgi:hypothetical protein
MGAEIGMLVVETIAKIRRAYFVHGHADRKKVVGRQPLGGTDDRRVILSSVAERDHRASSLDYFRGITHL